MNCEFNFLVYTFLKLLYKMIVQKRYKDVRILFKNNCKAHLSIYLQLPLNKCVITGVTHCIKIFIIIVPNQTCLYSRRGSDEKSKISMKSKQEKPDGQGQENKMAGGMGRRGDKLIDLEKSEVGGVRFKLHLCS